MTDFDQMPAPLFAAPPLMPKLGLGTWRFGENAARQDREIIAVRHAIDLGYRLIDTAEMYGEGGAETVVGRAVAQVLAQGAVRREELVVVSKVYPHNASRKGTKKACDASRRRLGLDAIDVYLLHWRGSHPLSETVEAFLDLKASGAIGAFGVSNFDVDDLEELAGVCSTLGAPACPVNQIFYALAERGPEFALLPWQRQQAMLTMAYSPLAEGALGKHKPLAALAGELGLTSSQVALAWLMQKRDIVPIPKAASHAHLKENFDAKDVVLEPSVMARLDAMFPPPKSKRPLAMI